MAIKQTPSLTLEQILEAVLVDVAQAQDASNKYSAEVLAPEYKDDTLLKEFPVPNALLSELELTLKMAVDNTYTDDGEDGTGTKTPQYNAKVLLPYVLPIVDRIKEIFSSFFNAAANLTEPEVTGKLNTIQRNLMSEHFTKFLTQKILKCLLDNEKVLLNNLVFDAKTALQKVMNVIEQEIYNQEQLDFIFGQEKSARKRLDGLLRNPIYSILVKVSVPVEVAGLKHQRPGMRMFVSAGELEDIGSDVISSLKIKVEIRNYKWATDPNNPEYTILLPSTS